MSLKAIHIVFIVASCLMTAFVGGWSFHEFFTAGHSAAYLFFGIACVAAFIGLLAYGRYFLKKLKHLNYL
jgi:hypothetical protein